MYFNFRYDSYKASNLGKDIIKLLTNAENSDLTSADALQMIVKIAMLVLIFVLLYGVAFFSNLHYRDNSEDVFFVAKSQWKAILMIMLPAILAVFMGK